MEIVNTNLPVTGALVTQYIEELVKAYPFMRTELLGRTAFQRPIRTLVWGSGPRKVLFTAAHHANEWITALVLLKYAEEFAKAVDTGGNIGDVNAGSLAGQVTIHMIPLVDPDGVDLVNGAVDLNQYAIARRIADKYPSIPFPEGWKANLLGTDLNLNYPAQWEQAKRIKYGLGYVGPAPRDFVGRRPLDQMETQILERYTRQLDPDLMLAYHSQGEEIYWQFGEIQVEGAEELGRELARVSGYNLAKPAFNSSFAGFKDWFIQEFRRPGYTVEVGKGGNPLPLSQFDAIYQANVPLMNTAAAGL